MELLRPKVRFYGQAANLSAKDLLARKARRATQANGHAIMSYLDKISACNRWDRAHFVPFVVAGIQVGWLTPARAAVLRRHPRVFVKAPAGGVAMHPALSTAKARSAVVAGLLPDLCASGHFPPPRHELYAVKNSWSDKPLLEMDRGLMPAFGARSYGVHVNGFVRKRDGLYLWIGTRTKARPVEPGKLDNMVAGGQPAGLSLIDNVIKESAEEAALSAKRAATAKPVGVITYCCARDGGLRPDTLFCYDLEMPAREKPKPSEEIVAFDLMPVDEVLRLVRTTARFKFNVNLVIIDFAVRHGVITPDRTRDFETIVAGLHRHPQPFV